MTRPDAWLYLEALADVQARLLEAEQQLAQAHALRAQLVQTLREEGFTLRETAALLGISHQRVSQIAA
jgi:DNA-directed RNA polymerase specialized sigma subunit